MKEQRVSIGSFWRLSEMALIKNVLWRHGRSNVACEVESLLTYYFSKADTATATA